MNMEEALASIREVNEEISRLGRRLHLLNWLMCDAGTIGEWSEIYEDFETDEDEEEHGSVSLARVGALGSWLTGVSRRSGERRVRHRKRAFLLGTMMTEGWAQRCDGRKTWKRGFFLLGGGGECVVFAVYANNV